MMRARIYFIYFLSLFIIISCPKAAISGDINWVTQSTTVVEGVGGNSGSPSDVCDNNLSTSYGLLAAQMEVLNYSVTATFPLTRINTIEISQFVAFGAGGGQCQPIFDWQVDILADDNWINGILVKGPPLGDNDQSISIGWDRVTKIRVRGTAGAGNLMPWRCWATHLTKELRAWGPPPYIDIGLRAYDGTNVIKIACEPVEDSNSVLRIKKGSNLYAIALVEPSDIYASKIRIKTKAGIKALAKIVFN